MTPGPLPVPNARRRNSPRIPTTELPAGGRKGRVPKPPFPLGARASVWWSWAWSLPQAAAWSEGDLYALARRASLEDDLAALKSVDRFDLGEVFGIADERAAMRRIEAMAAAPAVTVRRRLAIMREARALDDRYGLTAKGLALLRWKIVSEAAEGRP